MSFVCLVVYNSATSRGGSSVNILFILTLLLLSSDGWVISQ